MTDKYELAFEKIDNYEWKLIVNYGLGFELFEKSDNQLPLTIATNLVKLYNIPAIIKLNSNGNYTVHIELNDIEQDVDFVYKMSVYKLNYEDLLAGIDKTQILASEIRNEINEIMNSVDRVHELY